MSYEQYVNYPSIDASEFHDFEEHDRNIGFFASFENEALNIIEGEKITAPEEYKGEVFTQALNRTKIYVAGLSTSVEKMLGAMACGCLLITNNDTVLKEMGYVDNIHYSFYTTSQDLKEQVEFFLQRESRRKRMVTARNGQYFTTENHTDLKREETKNSNTI